MMSVNTEVFVLWTVKLNRNQVCNSYSETLIEHTVWTAFTLTTAFHLSIISLVFLQYTVFSFLYVEWYFTHILFVLTCVMIQGFYRTGYHWKDCIPLMHFSPLHPDLIQYTGSLHTYMAFQSHSLPSVVYFHCMMTLYTDSVLTPHVSIASRPFPAWIHCIHFMSSKLPQCISNLH